ncbi:hypothetical protein LPJ53_003759, partial [Coemansia erecta]
EYQATRAILYARADLPAHAARALDLCPGDMPPRPAADAPVPTRVLALSEILLAWTRAMDAERAWAAVQRLLALGYGRRVREWNALLHMHAVDLRYRVELLDEVVARMRRAGVALDAASHNIMMHACLLRGDARGWREWHACMVREGLGPDGYTHVAVAQQMADAGRWAEARAALARVPLETQQQQPVQPQYAAEHRDAALAVLASIGAATNQIPAVMQQFRRDVAAGRVVAAQQFAAVRAAALGCPAVWAAELALLARCLEDGRVEQSAAVDAVAGAAGLPGLDRARVAGRPLLQAALADVAHALIADLENPGGPGGPAAQPGGLRSARFVPGGARRSYAAALGAVVRGLLRAGGEEQALALRLLRAAEAAGVAAASPATLLALLRRCEEQPRDLALRLAAATSAQQAAAAAAVLLRHLGAGDVGAAHAQVARLARLVALHPSVRGFNALLAFARESGDAVQLERTWRQMAACGVLPNALSHVTRITCYALLDDQLRTRRAYTDMLQHGYPPTYAAVNALVRCCVRTGALSLALTAMRHAEAEQGVSLNVTTYNYVLARMAGLPAVPAVRRRMARMFDAMRGTPEERLSRPLRDVDVARRVAWERRRIEGEDRGHVLDRLRSGVGGRMLGLEDADTDTDAAAAAVRRALVDWLTSREAFSAEPSLLDASTSSSSDSSSSSADGSSSEQTAHPPAPNATTFIILVRMHGKRGEWADVLRVWDALLAFNQRLERVGRRHAYANCLSVAPFGRLVAWVIVALRQTGRETEAGELWDRALEGGVLGARAVEEGMDAMVAYLLTKTGSEA